MKVRWGICAGGFRAGEDIPHHPLTYEQHPDPFSKTDRYWPTSRSPRHSKACYQSSHAISHISKLATQQGCRSEHRLMSEVLLIGPSCNHSLLLKTMLSVRIQLCLSGNRAWRHAGGLRVDSLTRLDGELESLCSLEVSLARYRRTLWSDQIFQQFFFLTYMRRE